MVSAFVPSDFDLKSGSKAFVNDLGLRVFTTLSPTLLSLSTPFLEASAPRSEPRALSP